MEQRSRSEADHNHPRRLKMTTEGQMSPQQSQPSPQPPPPQKCPRCDSFNTKFCYYNNYSLSQPRYFCKTCRRYWTHGGTLRNVPVGGGCRKGKRTKTTSSSSSTSSSSTTATGDDISRSLPLPFAANQQQLLQLPPHITSMAAAMVSSTISGLPTTSSTTHESLMTRNSPWGAAAAAAAPSTTSLYPAGNLFSSLAAMHSFTRPQGTNHPPINLGGSRTATGSSTGANLPFFQGFDFPLSMKPQLQMHQSSGFQTMIEHEKDDQEPGFYQADQIQNNLVGHESDATRTTLNNSWNHGDANPTTSSLNFWNNSSSSTSSSGMAGSSANAKQWPNLPGFGSSP